MNKLTLTTLLSLSLAATPCFAIKCPTTSNIRFATFTRASNIKTSYWIAGSEDYIIADGATYWNVSAAFYNETTKADEALEYLKTQLKSISLFGPVQDAREYVVICTYVNLGAKIAFQAINPPGAQYKSSLQDIL